MLKSGCAGLEARLNEGKMHLMKMNWVQAEQEFYTVLRIADQSEWTENEGSECDWLKVEALSGLGETEMRRCKRFCHDDLTWFRGMTRSLAFYNEALYYVNKRKRVAKSGGEKRENPQKEMGENKRNKKKEGDDGRKENEKWSGNYGAGNKVNSPPSRNSNYPGNHKKPEDPQITAFFNQIEPKIKYQIKGIEDCTNKTLAENILNNCLATCSGKTLTFNNDWLKQLVLFCSEDRNIIKQPIPLHDSMITSSKTANTNGKNENFQPVYKRKIDFDRVQEAIMKLVNDVSIDVRRHYSHMNKLVPQTLIQQRLMSEVTRRLNPGQRDSTYLMQVLENAMVYEDNEKHTDKHTDKNTDKKTDKHTDNQTDLHEEQIDEEDDKHETIYMDIEPCRFDDKMSVVTNLTRASSPSCLSRKSHCNRFLQQLETASISKLSQTTCAKTISSKRSGLPMFEVYDMPNKSTRMRNILTVWRSHKPKGSMSGASSYASTCRKPKYYNNLQTFEEVSPLTEREKVLNWLQSVEESKNDTSPTTSNQNNNKNQKSNNKNIKSNNKNTKSNNKNTKQDEKCTTSEKIHLPYHQLSRQKLSYTLAVCIKKAAESMATRSKYSEALEVFKFALDVLKSNSTGLRSEKELMAELLRNIGMTKCSLGQISVGCQLMKESVGIYSKLESERDSSKISEVWFQLGGAFLSEELRKDSLFLRTMQLIQKELNNENKSDLLNLDDNTSYKDDDSEKSDDNSEKEDGYCVCIYEAMECYKQSLNLFISLGQNGLLLNSELYIHVLCNLADCYFMAGNMDLAEVYYEEALMLFPRARGNPIIQENSHVLSMLGSLNFLLGNYTRSATMYETSQILNQHKNSPSEPTLHQSWSLAMLGISYYHLGHFDKAIAWCTKAFSLYTRVLRGALFNADFYNHWFVIENLYSLGTAYATMNFFDKAIYYLKLGNRIISGCEVTDRQDTKQHVKVLRALGDSHASVEKSDVALKFYEEAVKVSKKLGGHNSKTALQNQLLNSMACINVDGKNYNSAGCNLEQALDYQKDVELSIKTDMVAVMKRLGATSVLACDIDKGIGSYKDCIQACRELHWLPQQAEEITELLCTLAILYHVKSCTMEDENQTELFMTMSEGCFQEAIAITEENVQDISREMERSVDIQYANYLYQQGLYADAIQTILPAVFCSQKHNLSNLVFSGIEQAVLPDHFQSDFHDDCMSLDASLFSCFLTLLCYKNLGLMSEADEVLIMIYRKALEDDSTAFLCNICAYAMMEMTMFEEACEMFFISAIFKDVYSPIPSKANINYWICLCVFVYTELDRLREIFCFNLYKNKFKKSNKYSNNTETNIHSHKDRMFSGQQQNSAVSEYVVCGGSERSDVTETWEEWTEEIIHVPKQAGALDLNGISRVNGIDIGSCRELNFGKVVFEETKSNSVTPLAEKPFNSSSHLQNDFAEDILKQQKQQQQSTQQQSTHLQQHQQKQVDPQPTIKQTDTQHLTVEDVDSEEEISESYSEEIIYGLPFAHKFHIARTDSQNTLTSNTSSPRSSNRYYNNNNNNSNNNNNINNNNSNQNDSFNNSNSNTGNNLLSPNHQKTKKIEPSIVKNTTFLNFSNININPSPIETVTSTAKVITTATVLTNTNINTAASTDEKVSDIGNNNYNKQVTNDNYNRLKNEMTLEINGNYKHKLDTKYNNHNNKTNNNNKTYSNSNTNTTINSTTNTNNTTTNTNTTNNTNNDEEFFEEWVTYEEVVDTPIEILTILINNRLLAGMSR